MPTNQSRERVGCGPLINQSRDRKGAELIRRNELPVSFADGLDPVVRSAYGECWDQANDEEYEEPKG